MPGRQVWLPPWAFSKHLSLRKEGQEHSNLGKASFIASPQDQRASKYLGQHWTYVMDLSVQTLQINFSSREIYHDYSHGKANQPTTQKTDKAN